MPDAEAALRTGRTLESIKRARDRFDIANFTTKNYWPPEHDALLGRVPDQEIVQRTGRSLYAVIIRRCARGLRNPTTPPQKRWRPEEDQFVGTARDEEIALRLNRTVVSVKGLHGKH